MRLRLGSQQIIRDYNRVFATPEGQRVLANLARRATLLRDGIKTTDGVDVNKLLVLEGEANVVKHIYTMLRRDPNAETPSKAINDLGD